MLLALRHREVNGGQGEVIDVALCESVFNVMESLLPEYDAFGAVRGAAGSALPDIAPSNAHRCADGAYVLVARNDGCVARVGVPVGRIYTVADIATDPQYPAREMVLEVKDREGQSLKVPGVVPRLSATPGRLRTPAPRLGEHNEVLKSDGGWPGRGGG